MKGSVTGYTTVFTTARFLYEIGHTSSHFEFSMLPPMASATTNGPGRDRTIGSSMEDSESVVIASLLCARSGICQKQTHGVLLAVRRASSAAFNSRSVWQALTAWSARTMRRRRASRIVRAACWALVTTPFSPGRAPTRTGRKRRHWAGVGAGTVATRLWPRSRGWRLPERFSHSQFIGQQIIEPRCGFLPGDGSVFVLCRIESGNVRLEPF